MSRRSRSPLRIADVSAEAILLAGGARAILLQLANPGVGHGVAAHSDFANRPLDRLHGTLTYLYVIVYGTAEESRQVARMVGEAHAPVHSQPGDDVQYDARDDRLQLWVAATLYDTATRVRELIDGPLPPRDAASLLADYSVIATALGVPRTLWPADPAAFASYWAGAEAGLRVDEVAQDVARSLLHPSTGPWWLRLAMPTVRLVTAGLLSPELRKAYGLEFNEARFTTLVRIAHVTYPRLPRLIRHAPKRAYLRRFRRAR
ncbi:MAG: DUF2236 domain-containing protein [Salinibacterium sp.]|nr:DUF2236 domain-containing protein [Salinibacterium sp.]